MGTKKIKAIKFRIPLPKPTRFHSASKRVYKRIKLKITSGDSDD